MDIGEWLRSLGLGEHESAFRQQKIDMEVLPDLTDSDLGTLGIPLGHRKRLLRAIKSFESPGPASLPATTERTAERRQLTVVFCDLAGSTALSTQLDPEDLREIIGAYHRCCAKTINEFGGYVAKYMGDGVLAYFGYPQAHEHDAERAIRGGVALAEAIPKLRRDILLQVRIGIATGVVVVGDLVGEGDAQERGVVGETPNLAARLQAAANPGEVVIAQATRRLTGSLFEYDDLGSLTLKGFDNPVQAWRVTAVRPIESRFEARDEPNLTPLIGREEELELMLRRWRQARTGQGRVVLLSGEPGIGKSRLLSALNDALADEPHTRLRYFCSPHHTDSALFPVIAQIERAAGFERTDTAAQKRAKLNLVLDRSSSNADEETTLVTELLSLPFEDGHGLPEMSPQKRKEKTLVALGRQLERLSRVRPLFVVYEDIHWIDPTTHELLDLAIEQIARFPVLLVATFRPEFQPPWIGRPGVTLVTLARLDRSDGIALVNSVLSKAALSAEMVSEIVDRADGIPLFVEELSKAVQEAESKQELERLVGNAPFAKLAVPATLHASLMARLDRLGSTAREVVQIGAAIGREFSYELLAAVSEKSDADLETALGRFVDLGLVFRRGHTRQATFQFKHALIRDAAYGTLLRAQRQQLHRRIAIVIERDFADLCQAQPELLGHHCGEAGLAKQAIEYYLTSAKRAIAASCNKEATSQLRKALALVETLPEPEQLMSELRLRMALGTPMIALKGYGAPEVEANFARAYDVSSRLGSSTELALSLAGLWRYRLVRGPFSATEELLQKMSSMASQLRDPEIKLCSSRLLKNPIAPALMP